MKFLDYDIKNGTRRSALEEWAPHEPMAPDFFEWNYIMQYIRTSVSA